MSDKFKNIIDYYEGCTLSEKVVMITTLELAGENIIANQLKQKFEEEK